MLVSAEAITHGWKFMHPCKHRIAAPLDIDSSLWEGVRENSKASTAARNAMQNDLEESLKVLGLKNGVQKDAIVGIVDMADNDEIEAKYGSKAEFEYVT
jgi:hypothetical protein